VKGGSSAASFSMCYGTRQMANGQRSNEFANVVDQSGLPCRFAKVGRCVHVYMHVHVHARAHVVMLVSRRVSTPANIYTETCETGMGMCTCACTCTLRQCTLCLPGGTPRVLSRRCTAAGRAQGRASASYQRPSRPPPHQHQRPVLQVFVVACGKYCAGRWVWVALWWQVFRGKRCGTRSQVANS
jgi:hypothetical protein